VNNITTINCSNIEIKDLTGISNFTKLINLNCGRNQLTSLDVSELISLQTLNCDSNDIKSLDVKKNTILKSLWCGYNRNLTTLNLGPKYLLEQIWAERCNLTSIDLSNVNSDNFKELYCEMNKLSTLDVSKMTKLTTLVCGSNSNLNSLDVSANTALVKLDCQEDGLSELDVTKNTALSELHCHNNRITALDLAKNKSLTKLNCNNDKVTKLDLSNNSALQVLYCYNCNLSSIDLSNNPQLQFLDCSNNNLKTLDLSNDTNLVHLDYSTNHLAALDLSGNCKSYHLTSIKGYNNSRSITAYSYKRGSGYKGEDKTGYYVPLSDQNDGGHLVSCLATLINNAGDKSTFDINYMFKQSFDGAKLDTINKTQVLILDATKKSFSYQYDMKYFIETTEWYVKKSGDSSISSPYGYFTINWVASDQATGVDCVDASAFNVFATAGQINVNGANGATVNVYNMGGQQVYSGTDVAIEMPAGMYIVRVDGVAKKIMVK
jgi:hypothetical protein